MANLFIYFLKSGICLGIFYGIYYLLLKNSTYFQLNRFFLIGAVAYSLIVPTLKLSVTIQNQKLINMHYPIPEFYKNITTKKSVESANQPDKVTHPANKIEQNFEMKKSEIEKNYLQLLYKFYLVGVFILIFKFIFNLFQISYLIQKSQIKQQSRFKLVFNETVSSPFSFLNFIFIDKKKYSKQELDSLIAHESIHYFQYHFIDLFIFELLTIFLWFNPFIYLYRKSLNEIHEYIADRCVLNKGHNIIAYQQLLLRQSIDIKNFSFINNFKSSFLKNRFKMMSNNHSKKIILIKYLFIIPFALIMIVFYSSQYQNRNLLRADTSSKKEDNNMFNKSTQKKEVLIENIESIFNQVIAETEKYWQPRSYICTRSACMRAAGWQDATYEDLMIISGYGTGFGYHQDDKFWAHYVIPDKGDERIARATGYGWEWLHIYNIEDYWQTLKASIDAGKPVHAPFVEEILFIGYKEADKIKERKVRPIAIEFVKPGEWWSWKKFEKWYDEESHNALGRHTERVPQISPQESFIEVLNSIVELVFDDPRGKRDAFSGVRWGIDGIIAYANDIENISVEEREFQSGWLGCHNVYPQWTARKMTSQYLQNNASLLQENEKKLALNAANDYFAAHEAWLEWEKHLGRKGKAPDDGWRKPAHRLAGAKALQRAIEYEKNGAEKIKQSLHSKRL